MSSQITLKFNSNGRPADEQTKLYVSKSLGNGSRVILKGDATKTIRRVQRLSGQTVFLTSNVGTDAPVSVSKQTEDADYAEGGKFPAISVTDLAAGVTGARSAAPTATAHTSVTDLLKTKVAA